MTIRALIVRALDEMPPAVISVEPTHDTFCGLVDDINTDTVFAADGQAMVKVGANGKAAGRPVNPRATQLLERLLPGFANRDYIVGPAVFLGVDDEGDPTDAPEAVVTVVRDLFGISELT